MKFWALLSSIGVVTCLLTAPPAEARLFSFGKESKPYPKELKVRTTAYTHTEADHLQYGRKTAAGGTLKYTKKYTSAAADWSKFPLGTKFKIDGLNTTFVVDDYGSALVGSETIDIYHPSKSAMNRWGVKHVDITILEYGDFEASREILEGRTKYSHVRKMLAGIKKDPGPEHQGPVPASRPSSPPRIPEPRVAPKTPPIPEPAPAPETQLAWSDVPPAPPVAPPAPQPPSLPKEGPAPKAEPETPTPSLAGGPPILDPAPPTATAPVPAAPVVPRQRKFSPLSLAGFSASPPAPDAPPSAPVEDPIPAAATPSVPSPAPAPSPAAPAFKKREFRPLMASVER